MPKKHVQKSSIEEISAESSTREDLKQDLLLKYQTIKKSETVKFVKKGLSSLLKFAESYHPDDPTNLKRIPCVSNSKQKLTNSQDQSVLSKDSTSHLKRPPKISNSKGNLSKLPKDPFSGDNPFTNYGNTFNQSTSKKKKTKKQEHFDMFNDLL